MLLQFALHVEFIARKHISYFSKRSNDGIDYYDSNFLYPADEIKKHTELIKQVQKYLDYYYRLIMQDKRANEVAYQFFINVYYSQRDVNPDLFNYPLFTDEELSEDKIKDFQTRSANKFTPLHLAILMGSSLSTTKILNDKLCNVDALDNKGRTALAILIEQHYPGKDELFYDFIQNENIKNLDPLIEVAIEHKDIQLIEYIIKNQKTRFSKEALLILAIQRNDIDLVKLLLKCKANILGIDTTSKKTPLEYAFEIDRITKVLIDHLKDVNIVDEKGNTMFHYAIQYKNTDILNSLINNNNTNFNITDSGGLTPIMQLRKCNWMKVIMLIDDGDVENSINKSLERQQKQYLMQILPHTIFDLSFESQRKLLLSLIVGEILNTEKDSIQNLTNLLKKCDSPLLKESATPLIDELNVVLNEYPQYVGLNALHIAYRISVDKVQLILEAGANPNTPTIKGTILLNYILTKYENDENTHQYVELFLKHKADISKARDILENTKNKKLQQVWNQYKNNHKIFELQAKEETAHEQVQNSNQNKSTFFTNLTTQETDTSENKINLNLNSTK